MMSGTVLPLKRLIPANVMKMSEEVEMMDELTSKSKLTEHDLREIADAINENGRKHAEEELE